ncbi:MAG TPA: hypothetical protein VHZ49_15460 [Methylomirabilota bacterium]|jgi:hypothetical protein|nr:hypothetical protein [Methylomirabilota bacterium]
MGMDPLDNGENLEVTIVLQGPVKKANFRLFQAEVDKFLDACEKLDSGTGKKLQVRTARIGVRKNV